MRPTVSEQMIVRIDAELKGKLYKLARMEGKSSSQKVRELIRDYIQERDIGAYVDDLWQRIGLKLKAKGVEPRILSRTIQEARKRRA